MRVRCLLLVALLCASAISAAQVDPDLFGGLKWRLIGPYRGGRSIAVAGSQQRPNEYYFGATGGGVWKTTDGGENWNCVSDGFFNTSSVGAVEVAPSNPDVVYAGMGESCIRGNIAEGDGIYKTTDAGKTWQHVGLAACRTISRIEVHPTNPDLVYVAALGHIYGPNKERGIYRSKDGGKSWEKVLFVTDKAGGVDLSIDPNNPDTIFASTWEAWRTPYTMNSGGPGSKLFKSTDGGSTWTDISRRPGMPKGVLGKIGVSVSPADSNRIYACVEAEDGGVFRSDDGGNTWALTSDNRNYRQRAWYYTHIYADPKDKDTVYVLNVGMGKSTDGGKTFSTVGTPHSDNHDLWIAPDNPQRMVQANDGGANVSTDGGRNWTEQDLPTAQFYHVITDNAFPYNVLGAQQDNSTVRIASRVRGGGITDRDWTSTAGGESGYIAPKPDDPDVVFGGSYGGDLAMMNHRTGLRRSLDPWPDNPMGHGAADLEHRFQWTYPIVFSPHDPMKLYVTSQYVLVSTNLGQTWKKISPDLTRNDKSTMGPSGGPITRDNTSVEYYGTVFTFAESKLRPGVLWAGSDDGLVHLSIDNGATWQNVTPRDMPKWGMVSLAEPSSHDVGTAYIAVDNHENDDYTPYLYRTRDFGRTWTKIVEGIPGNTFLRAVREDPTKRGLLYAGTETGVFVSFNDGAHWQPLQLNLPVTPVHDLVVKDNDLVVATHGRAFWILDNISVLRQVSTKPTRPYLYEPTDPYRVQWGGGFGGGGRRGGRSAVPAGENASSGVILDYYLPEKAENVKFEFVDSSGNVFMTLTESRPGISADAGMHRFATTLNYPSFRSFPGMILWAGRSGPISAPPGEYQVRMTVGESVMSRSFKLLPDPRNDATEADYQAQFEFTQRIVARLNEANGAVIDIRDIKTKIDAAVEKKPELKRDGDALKAKLSAIEEEVYQVRNRSGQDPLNYPIKLNDKLAGVLSAVQGADGRPTDGSYEVFARLSSQLQVQLDKLQAIRESDLSRFDDRLRRLGLEPIGSSRN